jgi:hypothetical protein
MKKIYIGYFILWLLMAVAFLIFSNRNEYKDHKDSPKFKVGDCVKLDRIIEDWETKEDNIVRILRIGKEKYLYEYVSPKKMSKLQDSSYINGMDRVYFKVDCPQ